VAGLHGDGGVLYVHVDPFKMSRLAAACGVYRPKWGMLHGYF
jgi:hypothetical protein